MDVISYALSKKYTDEKCKDMEDKRQQDKLKVTKVEKELNDFKNTLHQVNVNHEAKQSASGYGIISLPPNTANGQVSASVKGETLTNLLPKTSDNLTIEGGSIYTNWIIMQDGTVKGFSGQNGTKFVPVREGHKYLYKVKLKPSSQGTIKKLSVYHSDGTYPFLPTIYENELEILAVFESTKNENIRFFIHKKAESILDIEYFYFYDITGETETNGEKLNQKYTYISGTKSTISAMRITAENEDKTEKSQAYVIANDKDNKIVNLRSLPNGVKDEFNISTGVKTQRTKEKILEANDIRNYWTSYQTHDWISILKPTDYKHYELDTYNSTLIYGSVNILSELFVETGQHVTDSPNPKMGVLFNNTVGGWGLVVPKGTFSNVDEARAALAGTKLIYQLATPIEIPIQTSGSLVSYPSGTVYIEPFVADAGIYTDKMEVLHSDLPIKALEKISKVDFATGLETELDITAAVIAEDKLSFTHPDLVDGDIVFFTYEYDRESTEGETEIEYYDSRYVIKDSVTGNFYKWKIAVANGTPTIELEEV